MTTDSPFEGDVPSGGDEPSYEWIDEWLCEYVDGTMDPSLEAVFEKYVEANPDLKAHVERLQETRDLLCNCGLPREPSPEVEAEVCRTVEGELSSPSNPEAETEQRPPVAAFGLVSSVTAALIVGFLVGAMVVGPLPDADPADPDAPTRVATDAEASPLQPAPAPGTDAASRPLRSTTPVVRTDSAGPPSTLTPIGMP
jgi:anti-sigma factor RsiW